MKFVFVSYHNSEAFNNPEDWINRIAAYRGILECLSERHTVISIEQINYTGKYRHNGVEYHFKKYGKRERLLPWRLHLYVKNLGPDIVFMHGLHYPLQLLQLKWQLGQKTKIMVQHHAEKPFHGFKKWLQQFAERNVDAYLFTSREIALDWFENGNLSDKKKIREVMEASSAFYAQDTAMARAKLQVSGQPVFLWVGRLDVNKDPLTVVSAFLRFAKQHAGARLYMIYHTTELLAALTTLKGREDINDTIVLVGQIRHPQMADWYNSADFIISGSHSEGSGIAVCEAMSCGSVPIVTNIPSFRKMLNHCGCLYEPGDSEALFDALQRAIQLNLPEEKMRVIQQFKAQLSFPAIASQIAEIAEAL